MSSIDFNDSGIDRTVLTLTKRAKGSLESARSVLSGIKVPSDFSQGSIVRGAAYKISGIEGKIGTVNSKITSTVNKFKEASRKNDILANDLNRLLGSLSTKGTYMDPKKSKETVDKTKANLTKVFKKTGASIGNVAMAFTKGFGKAFEALGDGTLILLTDAASTIKVSDPNRIEEMQQETMAIVTKEPVNNFFKKFYKTDAGKWLDKNAISVLKTRGVGYQAVEGLGYVGGVAVSSMIIPGSSTGAFAAEAFAATTFVSSYGKYTEGYWTNAKKSAKPGEEWKTEEVWSKGQEYGLGNAVWEATQAYAGAKLIPGLRIPGASEYKNVAARIGLDTIFNAFDTPYRATVDTIVKDGNAPLDLGHWRQEFEKLGGWSSVGADVVIGAAGSAFGEYKTIKKILYIDKGVKKLSQSGKLEGLDQGDISKLKDSLFRTLKRGDIEGKDIPYLSKKYINELVKDEILLEHMNTSISFRNSDDRIKKILFERFKKGCKCENDTAKQLTKILEFKAKGEELYEILLKGIRIEKIENDNAGKILQHLYYLRKSTGEIPYSNAELIKKIKYSTVIYDSVRDLRIAGGFDVNSGVLGFNSSGMVHITSNSSSNTIIHEYLHSLGGFGDASQDRISRRGINECTTELIARKISGLPIYADGGGYQGSVETLYSINKQLKIAGIDDNLLEIGYFNRDYSQYKRAIDTIWEQSSIYDGTSLFDRVNKCMSEYNNVNSSNSERQNAILELKMLESVFEIAVDQSVKK